MSPGTAKQLIEPCFILIMCIFDIALETAKCFLNDQLKDFAALSTMRPGLTNASCLRLILGL